MNGYRFHGPHHKGIMRDIRAEKRRDAEERNARTTPERRRSHARDMGYSRNSTLVRELKVALHHVKEMRASEARQVVQTPPL